MRFVDIMIVAFWGGIESSHCQVLLNMRYNTTLITIVGWLKPCLAGNDCWISAERSKVQRSATSIFNVDCNWKSHKFNAALQTFEDQSTNSNQAKCNAGHLNDTIKLQSE